MSSERFFIWGAAFLHNNIDIDINTLVNPLNDLAFSNGLPYYPRSFAIQNKRLLNGYDNLLDAAFLRYGIRLRISQISLKSHFNEVTSLNHNIFRFLATI